MAAASGGREQGGSMAALARLQERLSELREEYFLENRSIDEDRKIKYRAAVKIQSWFRGCRVRAYLRHLNEMVILIQKWWRGYRCRKHFRKMVETAYFIMKMNFYNEMAVRIQKRWRGYYVRKYIHNYYALKKYLQAVSVNNAFVRSELQEYIEKKENEDKMKDLEKKEKERKYQARKMHYLLSTEQIAGIYNSPFRKSPDPMELLLRNSKPLSHRKKQVKSPFAYELYDWPTCKKPPAFVAALPLPPIGRQKPQGPFRDTAEVLWQRYKPLEPTLRVAESINSPLEKAREGIKREEWRNPIHDNEFLPFSSYHKKEDEKYEPSLCKSGKYIQEAYGTKHFREVYPKKWIADKDFRTVAPSILLFEKFGKTYSRAGQIV
ncbi:spermatogenesis-associated protein 17 isoform X1 [Myiozetetes cayanensis]|uniref:spermatogenesis-associated protein 17 isoform X1 n=1 Tax=Myiozetetes cayanensis TaxID=478635 RepID=UPI00215F3770|nr:spermatogenesis-associated protein 17 isoform X1 [Myiozetetes cayanensis]